MLGCYNRLTLLTDYDLNTTSFCHDFQKKYTPKRELLLCFFAGFHPTLMIFNPDWG